MRSDVRIVAIAFSFYALSVSYLLPSRAVANEVCSDLLKNVFSPPAISNLKLEESAYNQAIATQSELLAVLRNPSAFSGSKKYVGSVDGIEFVPYDVKIRLGQVTGVSEIVVNPSDRIIRFIGKYRWGEPADITVPYEKILGKNNSLEQERILEKWGEHFSKIPNSYENHLVFEARTGGEAYKKFLKFKLSALDLSKFAKVESPSTSGYSRVFHFTKSIKRRNRILREGFKFTDSGGMAGDGIYAVRKSDLKRTEKWMTENNWIEAKNSDSVLVEIALKENTRVLNVTVPELNRAYSQTVREINDEFLRAFKATYPNVLSSENFEVLRTNAANHYSPIELLPELLDCNAVIYWWDVNHCNAIVIRKPDAVESVISPYK